MFPTTMSPKVLNVEKLEKKFASLTKSRESILGLSTWIIRHKEFYREIVDQWLEALSKDMNALTMFYVANDVIQNCGRKKAPEFREAFGAVLERAVSLEKVKEIKAEVIRMLTLWHERSIYDAAFHKKLQDKLNNIENEESEEELDQSVVITNFKLEKLTDSLQKLKTLEEELQEKEEFLEDIEEPGIANIDNLIVKMDSQKELRKVDKFQKLVENYLSLAEKVMNAQKEAMLDLKHSGIFYSAQLEDAKKVAHAYRIYGKKVKMVEKALNEKLISLPEASPVLEEDSLDNELEYQSPGLSLISDAKNESSSQSSSLDPITSPKMKENSSFLNISATNEKYKSPFIESQNSSSTSTKSLSTENKIVKISTIVNVPNDVKEEKKILKSPIVIETPCISIDEKVLKSPLMDNASKNKDTILKSPIIIDATNSETAVDSSKNLSTEKTLKSPLIVEKIRETSTDQTPKSSLIAEKVRRTSTDQKSKSPLTVEKVRRTSTDQISKSSLTAEKVRKTSTDQVSKSPLIAEKVRKTSTDQVSKSPLIAEKVKKTSTDQVSKSPLIAEKVRKTSTDQVSKSPLIAENVRKISTDKKEKSPVTNETVKTSIDKIPKCTTPAVLENTSDKDKIISDVSDSLNTGLEEKKLKSVSPVIENSPEKMWSSENEEISSTSKESKKNIQPDLQTLSDLENIDFLLEKSYNEQRTKSKASFKRKIDNLLKLKQSKTCKLSVDNSSQENKTSSETSTAEKPDSVPIPGCSSDGGKIGDGFELQIIKEETIVNIENSKDIEKVSVISNSEEIDGSKINQSLDVAQNSKTSNFDTVTENISSSTIVPFTNFPDIPTELLKNILDKHRTNMNQSDSNQNSINYNANEAQDISSELNVVPASDSKTDIVKNNVKGDIAGNVNNNEDESKADHENVTESHPIVNPTPLMENLQNLLKCFSEKGPAFDELKNSKTLKTLPTMSLKSTLKLYHVLKEHHRNDKTLSSSNVNDNSETTTTSVSNKSSSVCNYNSTNAFTYSKNDNLEIMDMEVDSDDDNSK